MTESWAGPGNEARESGMSENFWSGVKLVWVDQNWQPGDHVWLPNLVLLGPVLVRWDHFLQPNVVGGGGPFLAAKIGPGDHFWVGPIFT